MSLSPRWLALDARELALDAGRIALDARELALVAQELALVAQELALDARCTSLDEWLLALSAGQPSSPMTRFKKKKRSEELVLFKPFPCYFPNLTAAMISSIQPTMNATPPIGVMAPRIPMPDRLKI